MATKQDEHILMEEKQTLRHVGRKQHFNRSLTQTGKLQRAHETFKMFDARRLVCARFVFTARRSSSWCGQVFGRGGTCDAALHGLGGYQNLAGRARRFSKYHGAE